MVIAVAVTLVLVRIQNQTENKYKHKFQLLQDVHTKQILELKKSKEQSDKEIQDLKNQLQTKRSKAAQDAVLAAASVIAPTAHASAQTAPIAATSDAKAFIYAKESGNNPGAINPSSGACGLGQALPCSKMPCSLSDYACQDQYFESYMLSRYGSWSAAQAFWLSHHWW